MTAPAIRTFTPTLRELESGLALPIPDRIRILRELEYDLEELFARFQAQGLAAEEARRKALEALVPDERTLRELRRLHTPWYRRVTQHLTSNRLRAAERTALVMATASVVTIQTVALLSVDLFGDPSPILVPILGLGALLFAGVATKTFELWIKRDHRVPERGLALILGLSGLTLATGIVGVMLEFYWLAAGLERAPQMAFELGHAWLARASTLLSASILLALTGGLAWFVLAQWVAFITKARRDLLGPDIAN